MRFLLKYPTRSRPELWAETLDAWNSQASGNHELRWLCSIDADDSTMTTQAAPAGVQMITGEPGGKVHAVNRDMEHAGEWDVLVVVSDDMRPLAAGWDERIAEHMTTLDCGLHFPDGRQRHLCTLSIMGRPIYERLGYIYHPAFKSVYCDNFYQDVLSAWGRLKFVDERVFAHQWKQGNNDALMARNESRKLYIEDETTYYRLKKQFQQTGDHR